MKQVAVIKARIVVVANISISSVRTQCSYVDKIRDGLNLNWRPKMNPKDRQKYLLQDILVGQYFDSNHLKNNSGTVRAVKFATVSFWLHTWLLPQVCEHVQK